MSVELARIKRRWTTERKVAAADIEWLLKQAERAETMAATKPKSDDFLRNLFGL